MIEPCCLFYTENFTFEVVVFYKNKCEVKLICWFEINRGIGLIRLSVNHKITITEPLLPVVSSYQIVELHLSFFYSKVYIWGANFLQVQLKVVKWNVDSLADGC